MKNIAPAISSPSGIGDNKPANQAVLDWVHEVELLAKPENVFWCDGSDREHEFLLDQAMKRDVLIKLNERKVPRSYLHRSNPNDVARVEQFTFICASTKEEAGPTNNWSEPGETYAKLQGLLKGTMRGRTLFVVPYIMGPPDSPLTKVGFEISDSIYVVLSMRIMTRMGEVAVKRLGNDAATEWNRGVHSLLDVDPARRFICHFPQDNTIISVGSGYGGNVLLSKKCLALRIGSYLARKQGWMAEHNSLYTNVALTDDGDVWWEGKDGAPPKHAIDWRGNDWTPDSKEKAAHPNSRFTAPVRNNPVLDPNFEKGEGVPISAIIFGGRRSNTMPLVFQSFDWEHGVYLGATMASETTAAATGAVGQVRRDPMAMLPFCGYNIGDYFRHWLAVGKRLTNPPLIFNVNWFRKGEGGKFLWPGFGDNMRVLKWIIDRCEGSNGALKSPIGWLPGLHDLDLAELDLDRKSVDELLEIDHEDWKKELAEHKKFFDSLGGVVPQELTNQREQLAARFAE